uniref:Retrovirus-related Pol polyprotein from transposon TNT 1-94 n=1 Tax=Cajanus cajan TaxID=3821 RepID=A0A151RYT6_CAJCA|nr:Retrovirus-related Pol polyprotein from transposon TNT 1-94 [Cajanus cajan]
MPRCHNIIASPQFNRHIVELGLTLLTQANLPIQFWDHAFLTSVYLINRLPSSSIQNAVPYHKLFHQPPDYHFLKVFGCSCFPHLRPYNKNKLQFRSQECVFFGVFNLSQRLQVPCH